MLHYDLLHTPDHHIRSAQIDKYVGQTIRTKMINILVNCKPKSICSKSKNAWHKKAKQDKAISKSCRKIGKHVDAMSDNTFEWNIDNQSHNVMTSQNFSHFSNILINREKQDLTKYVKTGLVEHNK